MIRILANDGMSASAAKKLTELGYEVVQQSYKADELLAQIQNFDVLAIRSATKVREPLIDKAVEAGRLKIVIRAGVGIDNVDVAYAESKGMTVKNTPNASSASVAELAIGCLFSLARHIHEGNRTMHEGKWEKKRYEGIELAGKTLGLIGLGRIGKCVAERAAALGMKVIYTNASGHKPENEPYGYRTLDELLANSDFISLHMPDVEKSILGAEEFAKMKHGAYLVNTGRGSLIDENALIEALDCGQLSAAALDVFSEEPCTNERIYTHPKLLLTPHIGASTFEAQDRVGEELVQIITEFFV